MQNYFKNLDSQGTSPDDVSNPSIDIDAIDETSIL